VSRPVRLTVDGRRLELDCAPDATLLEGLQEYPEIGALAAGCLVGLCGACTLLLDGHAVRPCSSLAGAADGKTVTTMAGLSRTKLGRALCRAWADLRVSPCGQCASGQVLAAAALLMGNPAPSDAEIAAELSENVCECRDRGDPVAAVRLAQRLLDG
jgi:isoquinoline 1-oxidoreductase subunit alpha